MTFQSINVGSVPNDGTGDALRLALQKMNAIIAALVPGTPQVLTTSGTIDTTKTLVILNSASAAIAATLPNGTYEGQPLQVVALASVQLHTLAGTLFEAPATIPFASPNFGVAMSLVWSAARTSWYPGDFNGGYKLGDLTAGSTLTGSEQFAGNDGADKRYTLPQIAAGVRSQTKRSTSFSYGQGATVAAGTQRIPIPNAAKVTALKADNGFSAGFTVAASIGGTAITGLEGLVVSATTAGSATATAANVVSAGGEVTLTFSSVSGSPTGGVVTLEWVET